MGSIIKRMDAAGDSIDAALVRAAAKRKLFGLTSESVTIGRFVVEKRLGAGGMGVVYEARDPVLDRKVALKLLHETADAKDEARLRKEAQALAKLRHPNVVAVHDVGSWEGRTFLTMEHVAGGTLRSWLRGTTRSYRDVAHVLVRAARALQAAHAAGLVHRDVKPENVLVGEDGEVRVVDFGLARRGGQVSSTQSAHGVGVGTRPAGTPGYVAPECLEGQAGDARGDQFSFCVMAYEALWGERPRAGARVLPEGMRTRVPAAARRALQRGLAVDPEARHPSLEPLVQVLERDRRRMILGVAGGAALVVGAVALTLIVAPRRATADDPCRGAAERVAEVWNPQRRAALEKAWSGSTLPYERKVFAAAADTLDRYAAAWAAGHRDACLAANVRHEQSPSTLDLRMRCLERRRAALGATVDLLAAGGEDVVEHAARIAQALPSIDDCGDVALLTAAVPPPSDPAARQKLVELEARAAEPITLAAAERFEPALKAGETLVADARALGYQPFLSEALVALGTAQGYAGRPTAEETLLDAMTAAQSSGSDAAVAVAAIKLVAVYATSQSREAHAWARVADATITRIGRPIRLVAEYEAILGNLFVDDGNYVEAVKHAEAAVKASEKAGQAGTVEHEHYLNDLGIAYDLAGRPDEARAQFLAALAISERELGDLHPAVARAEMNIGMFEHFRNHEEAALGHLERARKILETLGRLDTTMMGAQLLDIEATTLGELDRVPEALEQSQRSLDLIGKLYGLGAAQAGSPLLDRGNLLLLAGRTDEALAAYARSIAIYERIKGRTHPAFATAVGAMGHGFLVAGKLQAALDGCSRSVEILEHAVGPSDERLIAPLHCLGEAQLGTGHAHEALDTLGRARALAAKFSPDDKDGDQIALVLARAQWDDGQRDAARQTAREARDLAVRLHDDKGRKSAETWLESHP